MTVIDEFLGMSQRPTGIAAGVSGVGGGHGVTALQRTAETRIRKRAGKAAIAHTLELAVPAGRRHPDFEPDVGIAGWLNGTRDAAESRQILDRGGRIRWGERTGLHRLGRRDRGIRQLDCGKAVTWCSRAWHGVQGKREKQSSREGFSGRRVHRGLLVGRVNRFYPMTELAGILYRRRGLSVDR